MNIDLDLLKSPCKSTVFSFNQIDTVFHSITPENVAVQYKLASPFERVLARIIDWTSAFFYYICSNFILLYFSNLSEHIPTLELKQLILRALIFCFFLNTIFIVWFWNVFFEWRWNGRTLGKYVMGLRIITCDCRPITLGQVLLRNVLFIVDVILGPVVILVMGMNLSGARIGDLASRVVVVKENKQKKIKRLAFDVDEVKKALKHIPEGCVVPDSLRMLLILYISRRTEMAVDRLEEIMNPLVKELSKNLEIQEYPMGADVILRALYLYSLGERESCVH